MSHVAVARRLMIGFGNELRARRKHAGLSTRQLEDDCGVRHDVITRTETGRWVPTADEEQLLLEWMVHHPIGVDQ